jgi:GTP-binding protein
MIVAGNKCDLADEEQLEAFAAEMQKRGYEYFPLMAPIAHGTDELTKRCGELLQKLPPIRRFEAEAPVLPAPEDLKDHSVQITNRDGIYFVEANWLFRVMRGIRFDDPDGLLYFERLLDGSGVIDALRAAGCGEGDTVSIYDFEFDFID